MIQQLKYKTPIPIKAQKGTKVKYVSPRAQRAMQSNARNKAISKQYFNQSPSIQNLAKGAYYWLKSQPSLLGEEERDVITGAAPVVGAAVGRMPQIISKTKQILPSLAAVAGFMGGRSGSKPYYESEGETTPVAPEVTATEEAAAPADSTTTPPQVDPEDKNSNKPQNKKSPKKNPRKRNQKKQPSVFKEETQKVLSNIGKGYGLMLKGTAYTTGAAIPVGAGYGIYSMSKPKPTAADSLLEQQSRQLMELNKLNQAKQNQQKIDALRKQLSSQTVAYPDSTRVIQQKPSTPVTTSTQEQLDSINALWGENL